MKVALSLILADMSKATTRGTDRRSKAASLRTSFPISHSATVYLNGVEGDSAGPGLKPHLGTLAACYGQRPMTDSGTFSFDAHPGSSG
jgi:hypothetical protein